MAQAPTLSNWKRLFSLALPEAPILIGGTIALLIGSAVTLAVPKGVGGLLGAVVKPDGQARLDELTVYLVVVAAAVAISGFARAYFYTLAGERVVARLRRDLFSAIIRQEVGFFDSQRTGELVNRLSSDTAVIQNSVTVNVSMAIRFTVQAIGCIIMLFLMHWRLSLIMIGVTPVIAATAVMFGRTARSLSKRTQDALAAATTVAEESLGNVRTVRAFAREDAEVGRYRKEVDTAFDMGRRTAAAYGMFQGFGGVVVTGIHHQWHPIYNFKSVTAQTSNLAGIIGD